MNQMICRLAFALSVTCPSWAHAQAGQDLNRAPAVYPTKPVTLVVPAGAGGGLDTFARFLSAQLPATLGQPLVVENKAGANGAIGAQAVARAAPDGHTLLVGDVGVVSINPALYPKLPYAPDRDFAPVTVAVRLPLMLVSAPGGPTRTLADLRAQGKQRKLSIGTTGVGNISHLAAELLMHQAGLAMVNVPYKGAPALLADTVSGNLDASLTSVVSAAELIKSGKLRPLAVTGERRFEQLRDVPTVAESGMKGFNVSSWVSVHAPAGTPAEIIRRLNQSITELLASAEGRDWMSRRGFEFVGSTPEQAKALASAEQARWSQVIRTANVEAN